MVDESNAFAGHEVYAPISWVNQVNGWTITNQKADDESLHPNASGYGQWEEDLQTRLGQRRRPPTAPPPAKVMPA